ncbi:MAG: TetR family transcriptional regulator [Acidimicrobiia bacterium]
MPLPGLRERKKQQTRATIQAEALRLFAEQGYDATTCEQLAAAAGVSPATFFRYFPTKEDVVLQDDYDPLLTASLHERPLHEAPVVAVRRALASTLAPLYLTDAVAIRARTQLILSVPALRARMHEQTRKAEKLLAVELAARAGLDPDNLRVRAVAAALAAALTTAVESWASQGGELPARIDEALDALEHHLTHP